MPTPFLFGVNLAVAEFTPEKLPGVFDVDYTYPTHAEVDYYASKGMSVVRLPFLWERVQHTQNGPLDAAELARIDDIVNYATGKGLKIELDVHNYGAGFGALIGTAQTPNAAFADLWGKLALHYKDNPDVLFGLMNEPHEQSASTWLTSANAAIAAIRGAGALQEILVSGSYWDGAWTWTTTDNAAVIGAGVQDPAHNFAFEVHQYLDADASGTHPGVVSATIGVERLTAITQWAEATGNRLFLGEVGVATDPTSLTAFDGMLTYMLQHTGVWQGLTYWAGGPWWGDYIFTIEPQNGVDRPQMDIIEAHLANDEPTHAAHDLNGDGTSDILFRIPGSNSDSLYGWLRNDRVTSAEGSIDLYDKAFSVQIVGDFDGNGTSDVILENPVTGGVWEWRLDGTTIVSQGAVDVGDTFYHLLGAADFDGNGTDDLLWRNGNGFVYEWQMKLQASIGGSDMHAPIELLDLHWHVVGAGDFDGDGKADILLRNISATSENGAFYLWEMHGNTIKAEGGIERPGTDWVTLGTGDFDGDGKTDFAVRHVSNFAPGEAHGAVWIYLMNGTAIKSQGAAGIADAAEFDLAGIGDYSGDGKDDILFRNDAGYFYSWNMNGAQIASEGLAGWAAPDLDVINQHWDLV